MTAFACEGADATVKDKWAHKKCEVKRQPGGTTKKYALMATWWLHGAVNKKACYRLSSRLSSAHKACSGSSNWARTSDLRINRKPGSWKIYINQQVIYKNGKRVIFRVIDQKLQITIFPALS